MSIMASSNALALTGGIACGKSTVAEMLAARGWRVIDTDEIAHELMLPGTPVWKKVVDAFGPSILNKDESIHRRALGDLVFADPQKRQLLNALTHPAIRAQWQAMLESSSQQGDDSLLSLPIVVAIPLLYETGAETAFARVLCVGAPRAMQAARLRARGLNAAQIEGRLSSQLPVEEKMRRADVAIWNAGSLAALKRQVDLFAAQHAS